MPAVEPYTLDAVIGQTGQAAFGGQIEAKILMAIEDQVNRTGGIRGRPLHVVFRDDASTPATTVQIVNEIIAAKPAAMLGPSFAPTCQATAPIIKSGPVAYCFSPVLTPQAGSFVFSAGPPTIAYATAFFRYAKTHNWKRIALITTTDAQGQDTDDNMQRTIAQPEYKDFGMVLVAHERFNALDISVGAQLARIKAADPQAVIALAAGAPFATLMRGIHDAGLEVPIYGIGGHIASFLQQLSPVLPKELLFPGYAALVNMYRSPQEHAAQQRALEVIKTAGLLPDVLSLAAVDPAFILVDGLRALGPNATAEQLRAWIENLHGYWGVYGAYDFRDGSQRGVAAEGIVVERWNPATSNVTAMSGFGGRALSTAR